MLRALVSFLLLRAIRARHPELFDSQAALEQVEGALREYGSAR